MIGRSTSVGLVLLKMPARVRQPSRSAGEVARPAGSLGTKPWARRAIEQMLQAAARQFSDAQHPLGGMVVTGTLLAPALLKRLADLAMQA